MLAEIQYRKSQTIAVSAKDNAGNLGVKSTIVTVPHDQGR